MRKKRIAIINQRYGEDVNGGSEYYTRMLAEHLVEYYEVEVLTTTARDYDTWKPYYNVGEEIINGVKVKRFEVKHPRNVFCFKVLNKVMQMLPEAGKRAIGNLWLEQQGPFCPDLVEYIRKYENDYEVFLFFTYLYYTTAVGMLSVLRKSVLIPTAHDEYCIYYPMYNNIFCHPKGIIYLTEEEKTFVESLFHNQKVPNIVAGAGIDMSNPVDTEKVPFKYGVLDEYVIYVGRVDRGKCCHEMFEYFERFKNKYPSSLKLVVVGKVMMQKPKHPDILCLGYISDEDKKALMVQAQVLVLPSEFESLSLAVLESMALGVPVLVNGKCKVLKAHCKKSGAGMAYQKYEEFEKRLYQMLYEKERYEDMSFLGMKYIEENYSWIAAIEKYQQLLEG